uniref:Uncharacterized protein n=1 Tax=Rhizophora mucronata TaxID=61149 RepID=A0A2P2NDL8_RHIMU
MLFLLNKSI